MDILSESMNYFDYNIVLDDVKKTVSSSIKKDKVLSSNYKRNKSKILKYPTDKELWKPFYDKFNTIIEKL